MNKPQKHSAIIKAWADGRTIQAFNREYQRWTDTSNPGWFADIEYRIKPTWDAWTMIERLHKCPVTSIGDLKISEVIEVIKTLQIEIDELRLKASNDY